MHIYTHIHPFNADRCTPVGLYLSLRNHYRKPVLLEKNDYHSRTNSTSCIGLNPLVEITVQDTVIVLKTGDTVQTFPIDSQLTGQLAELLATITFEHPEMAGNGFFSSFGFEYAHYEETTVDPKPSETGFPKAHFILYEYLILLDHFYNNGKILVNSTLPEPIDDDRIQALLRHQTTAALPFSARGEATSPVSETAFCSLVEKAKAHILRGDVFQLVVSRPFEQAFFGDDFQVYRELRRLNPSPYLFYADMEAYRLMGSSPETQISLQDNQACIHPIAGTVRKTGNEEKDAELIRQLVNDDKENAEHTMLVDLARNDLSRFCDQVKVTSYKEIQQFSHVIHLVSKVVGQLNTASPLDLFSGTFPAGTLSGTPKPKALELIQKLEGTPRDYYGGAIGFIGTGGSMNLAIVIRSIFSSNNTLHFRAGAGIVLDSIPEQELQEVANKLGAVRKAIAAAHSPLLQEL